MNFAGRWFTAFGPMQLAEQGTRVRGTYGPQATEHAIEGSTAANELTFRYTEAQEAGAGRFWLRRYGSFGGEYVADGGQRALPWEGWRGCDGLWETPLGRLRFVQQTDERVIGFVEYDASARMEGRIDGQRLSFTVTANRWSGQGMLDLDAGGYAFNGEWRQDGQAANPFVGQRVLPRPGLMWLVVIEAHWQRALDESEFAFGHMLKELFARLPRVEVRHRFYHDEASLLHWCRQLLFLPEPAVLMLAGHGEANGLSVNGQIIALSRILDSLQFVDSLQLLHFSSCLVGQDTERALIAAPFPISGYTTSVDWAQSALTEFIYLDMILEKGLAPAMAAEQLTTLVRFAGSEEIAGSPYRPAGFCFFDRQPMMQAMRPSA